LIHYTAPTWHQEHMVSTSSNHRKYVVCHFMVGNTYPYALQDWVADIELAQGHGFDAFALNVGREDWQRARVADAYEAALQLQTDFKLFLSFDMTSIPGGSEADAEFLRQYLELVGHHPNYFFYQGRALVSTFAGDQCTFGKTSYAKGWGMARVILGRVCPVCPLNTTRGT